MRRSASCTLTTRRSAGLSGRDVRHVVAGARGAPARALRVDDGVDAGPRLRREMRRILESRVFIMWTGQSAHDSVGPWTWIVEGRFWATREIGGERREIFRERMRVVHAAGLVTDNGDSGYVYDRVADRSRTADRRTEQALTQHEGDPANRR